MHYDFTAIPDADVPQAVEPTFQHVLTTYASETNKTVSAWRAVPDNMLDFKPHEKTNSTRTILATSFSPSGVSSLSSSAPRSRPLMNSSLPAKSRSCRRTSTSTSG